MQHKIFFFGYYFVSKCRIYSFERSNDLSKILFHMRNQFKFFLFLNFQRTCLFLFIGINILTAMKQVITKCCCVWNFINVLDSLAATNFKLNSRCHLVWLFLSKEFHQTNIYVHLFRNPKKNIKGFVSPRHHQTNIWV